MKYTLLGDRAPIAFHYDTLALAALSTVSSRYVPWTDASLRPAAIQIALNDILLNGRKRVLEFGSGISTVYLAAMLARYGGRLISVDHVSAWSDVVKSWLTPAELAITTFVHAPLAPTQYDSQQVEWYDKSTVLAAAGNDAIDLLVVDGPPAFYFEGCLNRGPAVDTLRAALAPSATIILDDINRRGEQRIARSWSKALGKGHRTLILEAGIALWILGPSNNIAF